MLCACTLAGLVFSVGPGAGSPLSYRAEVLADAPAGYWRLGEASGTSAQDETANAITGTYHGGPTLGVGGAIAGDPSTAARLDGTNDLIVMGDPASGLLDFGAGDFSVEAWVKTTLNAERLIVGKQVSGPYWQVTVTDDSGHLGALRAKIFDGSVTLQGYGTARVDDGAWHHVAVVYDRDVGIVFYVDGALSGTTPGATPGSVSNTAPLQVGKVSGYSYFSGDVDEVAVYPRALTPARVQAHHAAASTDTAPPAVTLTTPAHGGSTSDTTPTFAGAVGTAPGDSPTVTVQVYGGAGTAGPLLQTLVTTATEGAYSVDATSALALGTYTARAEQSDAAANTGFSAANSFSVTLTDESPPAVTLFSPSHGGSTSDTTPTFAGAAGTAPGDSATVTVQVYGGAGTAGPLLQTLVTTATEGAYSVDATSALALGTYTARAEQSDAAANTGFSAANSFSVAGPVLVGAGDIATCGTTGQDEATADLLDGLPEATVFTLGDNAYDGGSAEEYASCYGPSWGRHRSRTRPTAGNHDYTTPNASGYFGYFGASAGAPGQGWYGYDLGSWRVVVLNSNCFYVGGCEPGSPQEQWLRAELAAHPTSCTLAYWHHPLFTSRTSSQDPASQTFWDVLYEYGADLILTGHAHNYERFAPQTPSGALDLTHGIRQIIVGTGGYGALYEFTAVAANSEVRFSDTHGVLKLTLQPGGYDWQFLPVAGKTATDSGSTACHGPPSSPPPPPPPPPPPGAYPAAVLADGPRGYWRLGDSNGTAAADETANGSTGSYQGGVILGVAGALVGDADRAARFDGSNDRVSMGDPANGTLDLGTSDFTAEIWLKTSVNGERTVLGKRWSGPNWLVTVTDDSGRVGRLRASISDGAVSVTAYGNVRVDDGAWHHVVVLFERDAGITFYVDGAPAGSGGGAAAGSVSNSAPLQLAKVSGYQSFNGDLDEAALYGGLLSPERIGAHYAAGR